MIQAPFGATTPGWPVMPSPAFPWPQATLTPPSATPPIALSAAIGNGPAIAPLPLSTPLVLPDGVTAPAVMAAVAMRRGLPQGPTNDHDVEELLYDAMELLPGASDVEVRCEGGRVTLTGSVPHKRIKRDVGELAWAIPAINDVQNNVTITGRRRSRPFGRENEQPQPGQTRKQS
ncbi:MAG TPA: BON domain-containing protein [Vicinamibacterales bacterium]